MEGRPPSTDGLHRPIKFAQAASKGLETHQQQLDLTVYNTACTASVTEAKCDCCLSVLPLSKAEINTAHQK